MREDRELVLTSTHEKMGLASSIKHLLSEVLESFERNSCEWIAPGPTSRDSGEARAKLCLGVGEKLTHPWSARLDQGVLSTNARQTMGLTQSSLYLKCLTARKDLIRVMRWMHHPLLELQTSFSPETNEMLSSPFLETVQIHGPSP
jgi:hypothetical protein